MLKSLFKKTEMPSRDTALPGRDTPVQISDRHFVNGRPIKPPFPDSCERILFGMGCFWGAERKIWEQPQTFTSAVGYAGGYTPNPSYEEVCTGKTGHNEVVMVVYENSPENLARLLEVFWESHDPTQGMRQGNDIGTQYRSGIYVFNEAQKDAAETSQAAYQAKLRAAGHDEISTEIVSSPEFFYAEEYHQQYLAKNPNGYCGIGGTGVCYR